MRLGFALFLIFLVLKLTHTVGWSWWWVTCPLWAPLAFVVLCFAFAGLCAIAIVLIEDK